MAIEKIAAVICEYNPFHAGHAALFEELRAREGSGTAIVAIMSGNYTQRGEPALFPKLTRAACAIRGGADLVLELPFPYSCSGAERFANAAIHIANSLGCIDLLFFGSEHGRTEELYRLAQNMELPQFTKVYVETSYHNNLGCAQKAETIYRSVYGEGDALLPLLREPNNLLGVEYIRALLRSKSSIRPLAFKRLGMKHNECCPVPTAMFSSAGAARRALIQKETREEGLLHLPRAIRDILQDAWQNGLILANEPRWLSYCLLYYRNCVRESLCACDSMAGGLGDRIIKAAMQSATPNDFFEALRSKKLTDAYLRRALLYGVFEVGRAQLNAPPPYTQILAMNATGQVLLGRMRKCATIPILNRPSGIRQVEGAYENSFRADSLYCALLEHPLRPSDLYRYQPYRECM